MPDDTWEALLADATPAVREVAEALRALVRGIAPEAREVVHLGWRAASYYRTASAQSEFVSVMVYGGHCNASFPRGVALRDPQGLLRGSGKSIRHVKVGSLAELSHEALESLIRQAWELAAA